MSEKRLKSITVVNRRKNPLNEYVEYRKRYLSLKSLKDTNIKTLLSKTKVVNSIVIQPLELENISHYTHEPTRLKPEVRNKGGNFRSRPVSRCLWVWSNLPLANGCLRHESLWLSFGQFLLSLSFSQSFFYTFRPSFIRLYLIKWVEEWGREKHVVRFSMKLI